MMDFKAAGSMAGIYPLSPARPMPEIIEISFRARKPHLALRQKALAIPA
jgi:hypothetical protein